MLGELKEELWVVGGHVIDNLLGRVFLKEVFDKILIVVLDFFISKQLKALL